MKDKISIDRANLLHPKIRQEIIDLITKAETVISPRLSIRIVQGLRTITEQDALYAQGRTKPGHIVTNSKGGASYHNYGLAADLCFLIDGKDISWDIAKDWDNDGVSDFTEVANIFKAAGYTWGAEFHSIKDNPHFQKEFGYTWQQLFAKFQKKAFLPNSIYLNI